MAEWLRRQIRISFAICFPMGAQVQILLVSSFSPFSSMSGFPSKKGLESCDFFNIKRSCFMKLAPYRTHFIHDKQML